MSHGPKNWPDTGILWLQDHNIGVPFDRRRKQMGARLGFVGDPATTSDPRDLIYEAAAENGMGTVGDISPWCYWQTTDREERGTGCYSMMFSALTAGGDGSAKKPTEVLPIHTDDVDVDGRFWEKTPAWPKCFPVVPKGVMMAVGAGTDEEAQHDLMLHTDPRLVAVNASEPAEAGTLVCDLQPNAEMCMGSEVPGKGGRHARLQSAWRVIPMDQNHGIPGVAPLNALAWNFAASEQDSIAGFGMCFARMGGGGGPITPRPPRGPITQSAGGIPEGGPGGPEGGGSGVGKHDRDGDTPCDFGTFAASTRGGHGIMLLAQDGASGPLTAGSGGDKHFIGLDKDGHKINSGHISTNGYFFMDSAKDAPLHFERTPWPDPPSFPLVSPVHLVYDDQLVHPHIKGAKPGMWRWYAEVPEFSPPDNKIPKIPRQTPPTGGPGVPTPTGPRPPGPGPGGPVPGPITPPGPPGSPPRGRPITGPRGGAPPPIIRGPITGTPGIPPPPTLGPTVPPPPNTQGPITGGGGSTRRIPGFGAPDFDFGKHKHRTGGLGPQFFGGGGEGLSERGGRWAVGDTQLDDVALYSTFHPTMAGFGEMAFRPQVMIQDALSFTHNPDAPREAIIIDESQRPQVMALRTWGGQTDGGEWDYQELPEDSRARGGTAHGGALLTPPAYELEDYFAINSTVDVKTIGTVSYLMAAPGVGFALGTPDTNGGLDVKSVSIAQTPSGDQPVTISQHDSSKIAQPIATFQYDTTDSVAKVTLQGTGAVILPNGNDSEEPTGATGMVRINTQAGTHTLDYWDGSTFVTAGGGGSSTWIGLSDTAGSLGADGTMVYSDTGTAKLKFTTWTQDQPILSTGAVPMGADLPMGGFKLTGLAAGSATGHSVRWDEFDAHITDLGSTSNGLGASLIGLEDPAGGSRIGYAATDVETALQDINTKSTALKGANLIGLEDQGGNFVGQETVELALEELGNRAQIVDIGDLGDVVPVAPVSPDVLMFDGANWTDTALDHTLHLLNVGTKTHAVIDTQIDANIADIIANTTALVTHKSSSDHDSRYVNRAGDTMTGDLGMGANDIPNTGKIAVGAGTVDANALVLIEGDTYALGAAAVADDLLVIKDLTNAKLNMVSGTLSAIVFSDANRDAGNITYDHTTGAMTSKVEGTTMVGLTNAGMRIEAGVSGTPDAQSVLHVKGNILAESNFQATNRNKGFHCWTDEGFGMELGGVSFAPALYLFGRTSDTDLIQFGGYPGAATLLSQWVPEMWLASNGRLGIGQATPAAHLHVTQDNASGAIPCLELDQDDIDQPFIEFDGTSSTGGTRSLDSSSGEAGACSGKIRITVNGTTRWLRFYADET